MKAGDAKPWVYRRESDQDRQAAEDHKVLCLFGLAFYSQVFDSDGSYNLQELRSTHADRQKPVTQPKE